MGNIIELKNIDYSYGGEIRALDNLSLNIKKGEALILKGPNGCGKSTLLKIMNGLIFPNSGEYFIYGNKGNGIKKYEINEETLKNNKFAKWFHQQCGFIFQNADIQLFCGSVEEEIEFGPLQMGLDIGEIEKRKKDILKLLQIEHLKDRAPYHLSGGEKRKVAIACILSMNPPILILDEPLAGLDRKSQIWLTDFLIMLKETGKTLIISTHNDEFAKAIGEKIVYMDDNHKIDHIEMN